MKRTSDLNTNIYITAGVLSFAGCFLMITFPAVSLRGVKTGLDLFTNSVLPTLFPFFILVNFMGDLGVPERIGRLFEPVFQRLFRCSGLGAFVWMFSLFSGYPMAARLVGEYVRTGILSPEEGKRILSFSCVSGPLFMVGTVGTVMLGNSISGYIIALGHYLGALLNGILFCHWILPDPAATAFGGDSFRRVPRERRKTDSLFGSMSDAIAKALRTLGLVLGYIVLFSMISEFLQSFDLFRYVDSEWMEVIMKGALEMTIGCDAASEVRGITGPFRLALCGFILGFGGCSIGGQSLSMLAGSGIKSSDYFLMKFCHGILSGIVTYALTIFAQSQGLLDLSVGLVYGTEHPAIRFLGKFHTMAFTARSMIVICVVMIVLVGMDHWIRSCYQKLHTYIKERRNRNL